MTLQFACASCTSIVIAAVHRHGCCVYERRPVVVQYCKWHVAIVRRRAADVRACGHIGNLYHTSPCRLCNEALDLHGTDSMLRIIAASVFGCFT